MLDHISDIWFLRIYFKFQTPHWDRQRMTEWEASQAVNNEREKVNTNTTDKL